MVYSLIIGLIASFVAYILTFPSAYTYLSFQKRRMVSSRVAPVAGPPLLAGALLGIAFLLVLPDNESEQVLVDWPFIICSISFVTLGVIDDLYDLSAKFKLLGQLAILIPSITLTSDLFGHDDSLLATFLTCSLEVLFLLLIVNAMNLLDGHDGLTCIVGFIVLTTLNQAWSAQPNLSIIAATMAIPGVLIRNYPPAKIYLGDSGSMLIGFWVGSAFLNVIAEAPLTFPTLMSGLLLLALPLTDTFAAILRRLLSNRKIFAGDRLHIHHRLQGKYLDRSKTLWVLVGYLFFSIVVASISFHLQSTLLAMFGLICLWSLLIWKRHFLWLELILTKGKIASILSDRD